MVNLIIETVKRPSSMTSDLTVYSDISHFSIKEFNAAYRIFHFKFRDGQECVILAERSDYMTNCIAQAFRQNSGETPVVTIHQEMRAIDGKERMVAYYMY